MRNRETCVAEGRAFLKELMEHESATGQPKSRCFRASAATRNWCRAHRLAEVVWPAYVNVNIYTKSGWVVTALGRRKIVEGLPS